jgi:hypothetical protein
MVRRVSNAAYMASSVRLEREIADQTASKTFRDGKDKLEKQCVQQGRDCRCVPDNVLTVFVTVTTIPTPAGFFGRTSNVDTAQLMALPPAVVVGVMLKSARIGMFVYYASPTGQLRSALPPGLRTIGVPGDWGGLPAVRNVGKPIASRLLVANGWGNFGGECRDFG